MANTNTINFVIDGALFAPMPRTIETGWAEDVLNVASIINDAKTSAHNERQTAPKISNVVNYINRLTTGEYTCKGVRGQDDQIYVEIENTETNALWCFSISPRGEFSIHMERDTKVPMPVKYLTIMMALLGSSDVNSDEFRLLMSSWSQNVQTSKQMSVETIATLCDSFYFTAKKMLKTADGKTGLTYIGELTDEEINQIGRSISEPEEIEIFGDVKFKKIDIEIAKREEEKVPEETLDEFFSKAKAGEFRLPASWDFNQLAKVPDISVLDYYVCSDTYKNVVKNVSRHLNKVIERMDTGKTGKEAIQNDYVNLILTGKPGTGKTTLAEALAATLQVPIYTCPSLRRGEEDEYQGKVKVNEDGFKFSETPFLEAYKNGGIVVLEEFNIIDPGVLMGVLGQAIEKPFVLNEDGYKPVERNPLCVVIATCNPGMEGSSKPNGAFVSRLPRVFRMDDPQDEDFIGILKTLNPEAKESDVKKVYKTFRNILKYLTDTADAKDVANELTLRHCSGAIDLILDGMSIKDAITNSIINTIFLQDEELAESTYESIVEPMR